MINSRGLRKGIEEASEYLKKKIPSTNTTP